MSEEKPTVSNDVGDQIGISAISEGIDLAAAIVHEFDQFGDDEAQGVSFMLIFLSFSRFFVSFCTKIDFSY